MTSVYGIDANLTVDRVEALLGVTIEHPRVVVSAERIEAAESGYEQSLSTDQFLAAFDLASNGDGSIDVAGYVDSPTTVVMSPTLTARGAESTLAHEIVHVVQRQQRWVPAWNGTTLGAYWRSDGREVDHVGRVLTEGTAQYVGYVYAATHLRGEPVDQQLSVLETQYERQSGATQLAWAPYYYGLAYVHDRIENTTGIGAVFKRSPLTTEQVLHDETPATEPRAPLSVDVTAPTVRRRGPQGELFARVALDQKLPTRTAERAAAGWGNDTLLSVGTGNTSGHMWVTRWDTPADAAAFADGVETFSALRIDSPTVYDVRRPARKTVVVTLGAGALVERTTIRASGPAVDVTVAPNGTMGAEAVEQSVGCTPGHD